jgi:hypothetical protein
MEKQITAVSAYKGFEAAIKYLEDRNMLNPAYRNQVRAIRNVLNKAAFDEMIAADEPTQPKSNHGLFKVD